MCIQSNLPDKLLHNQPLGGKVLRIHGDGGPRVNTDDCRDVSGAGETCGGCDSV